MVAKQSQKNPGKIFSKKNIFSKMRGAVNKKMHRENPSSPSPNFLILKITGEP